jgi:hypothetical protein
MTAMKTRPTRASVTAFLNGIADEQRRNDCEKVAALMKRITKETPTLWGTGMVGFGRFHYKYASGREGDWFLTGFSPRKTDLTVYICSGLHEHADLLARLGKYRAGKSCLYLKKLEDVDVAVLSTLIERSVLRLKQLTG